MAQSTRGVRPDRRAPNLTPWPAAYQRMWRQHPVELSRQAHARLAMLDWHRAHGEHVTLTARHFGYSRPTVYRWLGRFERHRLESLENRSSRPMRRRRPTWTAVQLRAVRELRERYPRSWQGQARRPAAAGGSPPVLLDGGTDPRAPLDTPASCTNRPGGTSACGAGAGHGRMPCGAPPTTPSLGRVISSSSTRLTSGRPGPLDRSREFTARDRVSRS